LHAQVAFFIAYAWQIHYELVIADVFCSLGLHIFNNPESPSMMKFIIKNHHEAFRNKKTTSNSVLCTYEIKGYQKDYQN